MATLMAASLTASDRSGKGVGAADITVAFELVLVTLGVEIEEATEERAETVVVDAKGEETLGVAAVESAIE